MSFTSRGPRTVEEIETCVAMLEDSPFYDAQYGRLSRRDVVKVWETLLTNGQGSIDIVENQGYDKILRGCTRPRKNPSYAHSFFSCYFIVYLTHAFLRELITNDAIPDITWHFVQSYHAHLQDNARPAPAATIEEMLRGHNQEPGHGLYGFESFVIHPEIESHKGRVFFDLPKYARRLKRSAEQLHGGLAHHAWINNVAREDIHRAYLASGHKLLREHSDNPARPSDTKNYVFCMTKSRQVSDSLGIPGHIHMDIEHEPGNWFAYLYHKEEPRADLTREQQHACYLIALGYTQEQIAVAMFPGSEELLTSRIGRVNFYQHQASKRLKEAKYDIASGSREKLRNVILHNMHEVRSLIAPLYPWPAGTVLPE